MNVGSSDGAIRRHLQILFDVGPIGDLSDGQLLERFATDRDEVAELAFAALVERHQALVWRICLAILRDRHQAEDTFQATFLVLVRKSRSLWVRDSLGPWLHEVACRTASCQRAAIQRRIHQEQRHRDRGVTSLPVEPSLDLELTAALHAELSQLPARYRLPLVLCDLEGQTHAEAARSLGWPIGTVKSRQARGRRRLRDLLRKRGFPAALVGAATEIGGRAVVAAVPRFLARNLVTTAIRRSVQWAPGLGVSAQVFTLAQGTIRTMLWTKIRSVAAITLALGIATGSAGLAVRGAQEPAAPASPAPIQQPTTSQPRSASDESARRQIVAQELAIRKARIAAEMARLNRDLAELAVEEYEQVTYPRDLANADGEVESARSNLMRAEDRAKWSASMVERKYLSSNSKRADELALAKAWFELEQAQTQRDVLIKYTHDKTLNTLRSEGENAMVH